MKEFLILLAIVAASVLTGYGYYSKTENLYWENVEKHADIESYASYLQKYPKGEFKLLAKARLAKVAIERYQLRDNVVIDTANHNLMWMRCSLGQTWNGSTCTGEATEYTWEQALKTPADFSYAGYSDWRLPTIEELKTLVYCDTGLPKVWNETFSETANSDSGCKEEYSKPTILTAAFPHTPDGWAWSSSPVAYGSNYAWVVDFYYGYGYWYYKDSSLYVRLVRGGQ